MTTSNDTTTDNPYGLLDSHRCPVVNMGGVRCALGTGHTLHHQYAGEPDSKDLDLAPADEATPRIADVILEQLGGSRFLAMTGASHLVAGKRALHMRLPGNATGANLLSIELAPNDTYRLTFHRFSTGQVRLLLCDIYAEGLRSAFEHATNLATSIGNVSE